MSSIGPEVIRVEVNGADLGAVRWRGATGAPIAIVIHGLTSNAWSWSAVARHLDGRIGLVAVDLRGRGLSSAAGGRFGIRQHADDVAALIRRLNASPAVVAGHSMGAAVALAAAERHRDDISRLVLIEGGPPVRVPDDVVAGELLDDLLGPALDRLRHVWVDRVAYRSMWSNHPAFDGLVTPENERYLLSDLVECEGGFESCVNEAAVAIDGGELVTDQAIRSLLDRRVERVTIIRAETGLSATPPPLLDDDIVERYVDHDWRTVPGSNHYSVLIGEDGAAAVAAALVDAAH